MRHNPDAPRWARIAIRHLEKDVERDRLPVDIGDVLGCGSWGCVYSIPDDDAVLKITTDPSEISFIRKAIDFNEWPEGIVKYYEIRKVNMTFRERDVFAIWREPAIEVGLPRFYGAKKPQDYEDRCLIQFGERLDQFKDHADRARNDIARRDKQGRREEYLKLVDSLEQWAWDYVGIDEVEGSRTIGYRRKYTRISNLRGAERTAASLRACFIISELMEHEYMSSEVGSAISFYLEKGILLADVHSDNVGMVERDDWVGWVITDPGHAVDLRI